MHTNEQKTERNAIDRITDILAKIIEIDRSLHVTTVKSLLFIARHS